MHEFPSIPRPGADPIPAILDLARWAPSGDNTQPWRFEVAGPGHIVVHAFDTRDHVVYDLRGQASQLSVGALLETMAIAASAHRLRLDVRRRPDVPEDKPVFDVLCREDPALGPDPLLSYVPTRVTQRRPMNGAALGAEQKAALEKAARAALPGAGVCWLEGPRKKATAQLLFRSAHIRLTTHEAYRVHSQVIQWHAQFSDDRLPDQAIGVDPPALQIMRWAMKSWNRVRWMNRLLGTWATRFQLDYLPGVRCGAHFLLLAPRPAETLDDFVAAGRAVQRFWLTAAQLGLQFQPEMTPLIFARYVRDGLRFTADAAAWRRAHRVAADLAVLAGSGVAARGVFMGRVGRGPAPRSRSLRLPLERLMWKP
jgi:nitroreductase